VTSREEAVEVVVEVVVEVEDWRLPVRRLWRMATGTLRLVNELAGAGLSAS